MWLSANSALDTASLSARSMRRMPLCPMVCTTIGEEKS